MGDLYGDEEGGLIKGGPAPSTACGTSSTVRASSCWEGAAHLGVEGVGRLEPIVLAWPEDQPFCRPAQQKTLWRWYTLFIEASDLSNEEKEPTCLHSSVMNRSQKSFPLAWALSLGNIQELGIHAQ